MKANRHVTARQLREGEELRGGTIIGSTLIAALLLAPAIAVCAGSPRPGAAERRSYTQAAITPDTPPSQLTLTLNDQGMTPASATVSGEIVHVKVVNQSSRAQITLRVIRESGEVLKEVSSPDNIKEWNTELQLASGQYTITEAGNSAWTCRVTVQAPPPPKTAPPSVGPN